MMVHKVHAIKKKIYFFEEMSSLEKFYLFIFVNLGILNIYIYIYIYKFF